MEPESYYMGFLQQNKWLEEIVDAPTFHPTLEEFADPAKYIQLIEPLASQYGICKIQPPKELQSDAHLFSEGRYKDFRFTVRSQKMREHEWDDFNEVDVLFDVAGSCTLEEFQKHANDLAQDHLGTVAPVAPSFVEVEYWRQRSMVLGRPMYVEYGNDVEGSAFQKSNINSVAGTRWNLQDFGKDNGSILRHLTGDLPGITSPMLYIGSVFATFFWHVEDHFMHSINFMHSGAPKTWYGVPGEKAQDFEDVCLETVYKTAMNDLRAGGYSEDEVKALGLRNLMKKTTMFSPKHLVEQGIPVFRVVQNPGEFVVTFPRSYHGGFSHGFNIGEAVNFGLKGWFEQGECAVKRYCWLRMQQILPHEELLVRESFGAEAKYRDQNSIMSPDDKILLRHFIDFMDQQRKMRHSLIHQGMNVQSAYSPQQSYPCFTCGRKSFLAHVIIDGTNECHCLSCACKEQFKGKTMMLTNPAIHTLESIEGSLRLRLDATIATNICQERAPVGKSELEYQGTQNPAQEDNRTSSPSSASTIVNSLEEHCHPSEAQPPLCATEDSSVSIEGQIFRRRRLTSSQANKAEQFVLLDEMLTAMGAPIRDLDDAEHLLGILYDALQSEFHLSGCFESGLPQRAQFRNLDGELEEGIAIREPEAQAILRTVDGQAKAKMLVFISNIWDNI